MTMKKTNRNIRTRSENPAAEKNQSVQKCQIRTAKARKGSPRNFSGEALLFYNLP